MRASWVTGMKSASGSNGCLPRCGLTENTLSGASSQVWPSGALFATGSAPMFWLPPGRFSTTTGCGHCNPALSARAMVSGEPPGVSGTMMRTGLSGKPCAWATVETRAARPAASHLLMSSSARFRAHSLPIRMRGIRCPFTEEEVMLTPEELAQLSPAESLFPSPIPVQFVSSDEYMPAPQSAKQREFEARIKESGAQLAKKHGMSRRKFFKTAGGMAAAFAAMNEVHAKGSQAIYEVGRNETTDLELAQARADSLKNQFVMDMHTHFLREGTPIKTFIAQRETVGKAGWNPALKEKPQTIDDLMFPNYVKEIFLDSDTKVACISGSYSVDEKFSFLTNQMKFDAREKVNKEAGARRLYSHAIFTPGHPGWLEKVEEENSRLKPDSWKGYTIGDNTNKHLSKWPFRLDDEKVMYPFYEKLVKWSKENPDRPGLKNVCIHKGLFPPSVERQFPHLVGYCTVADVGQAAKDWPQLNFVIYHSAYRWVAGPGGTASAAWDQLQREGRVDWVSDLAVIPEKFGVKNVYADLGQIFAHSNMAEPRVAAYMLGIMIKGMGADHVVWGTDSLWTGAPQWQIEALRRLEIPEELQKKYGLAPMGPANGPVKSAILGGNNARLYGYTPKMMGSLENDRLAYCNSIYDKHGGERTNLAYGYINKG